MTSKIPLEIKELLLKAKCPLSLLGRTYHEDLDLYRSAVCSDLLTLGEKVEILLYAINPNMNSIYKIEPQYDKDPLEGEDVLTEFVNNPQDYLCPISTVKSVPPLKLDLSGSSKAN